MGMRSACLRVLSWSQRGMASHVFVPVTSDGSAECVPIQLDEPASGNVNTTTKDARGKDRRPGNYPETTLAMRS